MSAADTHYDVLGVSVFSEPEVIEAAYRALIKKYHPDRSNGASAHLKAARLNEAYRVLRDPTLRSEYDTQIGLDKGGTSIAVIARKVPGPNNAQWWIWGTIALVVIALALGSQTPDSSNSGTAGAPTDLNDQTNSQLEATIPSLPATVDEKAAHRAARHFRLAIDSEGLAGAQIYSLNCYESLKRTFSWRKVDQCAAFDATTVIEIERDSVATESTYFNNEAGQTRFTAAISEASAEEATAAHHYSLIKAAALLNWKPAAEPITTDDEALDPEASEEQALTSRPGEFVNSIPVAFRGNWDEVTKDKCEGREARFYFGENTFMNFEVEYQVKSVKLYGPNEMDMAATWADEDGKAVESTWMFKLVDGEKVLTGRRAGAPRFFRCGVAG